MKIKNLFNRKRRAIDVDCVEHEIVQRTGPSNTGWGRGVSKDVMVDGKLMIPTEDITHYLVQEFDTQDRLKTEIDELKEKLNLERDNNVKYNATLVTIKEYKKRVEAGNDKIKSLEEILEVEKANHRMTTSELETYKVERVKKLEDYEETKRRVKKELIKQLNSLIKSYKGNLSKDKMIALVKKIGD